jgi:hypothetical protein
MAGKKPSFITGATAKIKVAGLTMAYAQDVSYNATITTIPIETMGRYEVVSNEPVAFFVDGSLSVIRYTKGGAELANPVSGSAKAGNSVNQWGTQGAAFDPGKLLGSETFDLEIFSKLPGDNLNVGTNEAPIYDTELVIKLKDCRFTRKGGSINKRGVLVEQYAFNAILADNDDAFQSSNSGDEDLSAS